ncbi:MAG: M28 family peptidase [Acidimicrobiales bacterium]|nr:M28 family peptidase [Acidimicrobiales bacterium]
MTERPLRPRSGRRSARLAVVAITALASMTALPASAGVDAGGAGTQAAPPAACERGINDTYDELLECVTAEGVFEHLDAFQAIADANGDTRASATPGYDASADYVADQLEAAGYDVTRQVFEFPYFEELTPAVLEQVTPVSASYATGAFEYSGGGTVTEGDVVPVDINLDGDRASTSGCETTDFDGVDLSGDKDIALIQRGSCTFAIKALNAQTAGAEAVVIFNQGSSAGNQGLIVGTLGDQSAGVVTIPVVGASFADGASLAQPGSTANVATDVFLEFRSTENVIADSTYGNPDNVVMSGAHLDSVLDGPGINDNGSGSAALLETALTMANVRPHNQLRFAWWGAEESGLVGSTYYVDTLPEDELGRIALYMNYDMVGSPNFVHTVYDADESTYDAADFGVVVPDGSTAIEDVYESFYTWRGVPYDDTGFSGRSDYQAFIFSDIPSSGLFTGAEVAKTPEQQAIWGGIAGESFDQCYHQACDTVDNVDVGAIDVNSDAIAFATLTFAYSTESVNGVGGRPVPGRPFTMPEPAGPEGTFVESGGAAPSHGDI